MSPSAFIRKFSTMSLVALFFILSAVTVFSIVLAYFEQQLPAPEQLKDIHMQIPLRIYTQEGDLIADFGEKHRIPAALSDIPPLLIKAVVATEDQRYYEHPGVDILGLFRAAIEVALTGRKSQGGSTITMQVARNFFLTRDKTYSRKIKEILLALKISRELDKDKVLELYLNGIYLGNRAYGVVAAAQTYYGKSLNQLSLGEIATLAGLPKAPSSANPLANIHASQIRRSHVLERLLEQNYITKEQFESANKEPIRAAYHRDPKIVAAPYVAESVRDKIVAQYGEKAYTLGLNVYTTIKTHLQQAANQAVDRAVFNYDHRHGYRGTLAHWNDIDFAHLEKWKKKLGEIHPPPGLSPALVLTVQEQQVQILLASGSSAILTWKGLAWAVAPQALNGRSVNSEAKAGDILKIGDVIYVKKIENNLSLAQIPKIQAALVSLNPQNGAILALVGGVDFYQSNFNRIYQAHRQVGSSFKPFLYAAALNKGFTLASMVNDAPFVAPGSEPDAVWRPKNDDDDFMGLIRLRTALTRSRNLVSIRLLQSIGIPYFLDYIKRFGFDVTAMPNNLTLALGSAAVSPIQIANALSIFANGGYKINDYLIDRVENNEGKILYQAKALEACEACIVDPTATPPKNEAPRVISPQIAYLITSAMQSVIQEGTGHSARILNRSDLAGKTGTTNENRDTWFEGFNSDILTTVWVGFDEFESTHEYGAQTALPLWIDFMRVALKNKPLHTLPRPSGLITLRINAHTGEVAAAQDLNGIFETFISGTEPAYYPREKNAEIKAKSIYN